MIQDHGPLTVYQFPCLQDNYGFLLRDCETGTVAAIDTPDADAISAALDEQGWTLDLILNTHWHPDHTGGNLALKERQGAKIIGPAAEGDRIPGRDEAVREGDKVAVGNTQFRVMETPGHTMEHVCYICEPHRLGFVGDTLFSLGCGRLFEGNPEQMWSSLKTLRELPGDMTLYCAHEYTAANARFVASLGEANPALEARMAEIVALRSRDEPTVPMTLEVEQATNPFLRADAPTLRAAVGLGDAADADVFAEVRRRKDQF